MGLLKGFSARAAAGLACYQGFLFSLFHLGNNQGLAVGQAELERADLLAVLLFMVVAFALVRFASPRARRALLAPTLLGWYSVLVVVGSLLLVMPFDAGVAELVAEGVLVGLPCGLLLCAWGQVLSARPLNGGSREIVVATAGGALACLLVAFIPVQGAAEALSFLPIGSVWALRSLAGDAEGADDFVGSQATGAVAGDAGGSADGAESALTLRSLLATPEQRAASARLSFKMVAGTSLFGLSGGFMETFASEPGMVSTPAFPATLLILALFCIASCQLLVSASWGVGALGTPSGSDGGKGAADGGPHDARGADGLLGVYRLALLVSMAGFLFIPVLGGFGVTGESVALAGYLGLTCVLMALFLAMARAVGQDASVSFARGFSALYLGEVLGIALGNALEVWQFGGAQPYVVAACAGLALLFAYLFLFSEKDFTELATIVSGIDTFDEMCARIASEFGLSKREAEVLPLALRGRTGERIASELHIAKSTADTHLRRIYSKAGVHGRQELIDLGEQMRKEIAS